MCEAIEQLAALTSHHPSSLASTLKMSLFELPEDKKTAAQIAARQRREAERKERIFNDRTRTMGLDVDTLKQQEEERKERERREKEEHQAAGNGPGAERCVEKSERESKVGWRRGMEGKDCYCTCPCAPRD